MLASASLLAAAFVAVGRPELGLSRQKGAGVPAALSDVPRCASLARLVMAEGSLDSSLDSSKLSEMELAEQKAKLEALATKWRKRREQEEDAEKSYFGWVKAAEANNGRFAMFFLPVGLITEYYTGESMPQQVYTLFQTLGFVE